MGETAGRPIDFFKMREITSLCTSMSSRSELEETGVGLSSAFDTWIHLTNVQSNLERTGTLVVVKSRGTDAKTNLALN